MTTTPLPHLHIWQKEKEQSPISGDLLLLSEGFEDRSLYWISGINSNSLFSKIFVFQNLPKRKSRLDELIDILSSLNNTDYTILELNRSNLIDTEIKVEKVLLENLNDGMKVWIDISVMSRYLIILLLVVLARYNLNIHIIYSEPTSYHPSEEEFRSFVDKQKEITISPAIGVDHVWRTPLLSSSIMQTAPVILLAFTSFNEQLIRAILSSLNPAHLYLINSIPPHLTWRSHATLEVCTPIREDHIDDNPISGEDGLLERRSSTLDYSETVELIAKIYKDKCYTNRLVITPTGSKMQSLAIGFVKACCPDIHIEYPTPESYFIKNYSATEIKAIHYLTIPCAKSTINHWSEEYGLNG